MRSTFATKQAALAVACGLALGVLPATAGAQARGFDDYLNEKALLLDTRGAPVMSGTGLCWHTGYGPAPLWTGGCHADVPALSGHSVWRRTDRQGQQADGVGWQRQIVFQRGNVR